MPIPRLTGQGKSSSTQSHTRLPWHRTPRTPRLTVHAHSSFPTTGSLAQHTHTHVHLHTCSHTQPPAHGTLTACSPHTAAWCSAPSLAPLWVPDSAAPPTAAPKAWGHSACLPSRLPEGPRPGPLPSSAARGPGARPEGARGCGKGPPPARPSTQALECADRSGPA